MDGPGLKISTVIPAHNEEGSITETIDGLVKALEGAGIDYEILVVDDSSTDRTRAVVQHIGAENPRVRYHASHLPRGFGFTVRSGLDEFEGDAVAIVMADASDDPADLVRYHRLLEEGYDCAFGSRFMRGGAVHDYPRVKLVINRLANSFIRLLFRHGYNDTTNAFKAYRREVIDTVQPLLSNHFNLTVELPLKAIVRGHSYGIVPITWRNRKAGTSKLSMQEMGSRYLFIVLYALLERYLSRGDYVRSGYPQDQAGEQTPRGGLGRHAGSSERMTDIPVSRARRSGAAIRSVAAGERLVLAVFAFLVVVAFVLLYRKGLGTTFYYDEWNFVMNRREWDVETFLRAHNEHLSLLPVLIFKLLFVTVGLDSYGVYRVLLLLLHVVCVVLVYFLARERVEPPLALGVAAVILFLGAAWNDLLVPFQISFLLSVAAGLGMLIALERRDLAGTIAVALLLAVSLASSSVGIAFGAAAAVHVLVRDDRLSRLWAVAVPGALYLAWLLEYGDPTATSGGRSLTTLAKDNLPAAPGYVATAAAGAWGAVTGLGVDWARPLALASFLLLAYVLVRSRALSLRLLALLAAAAAYWGLAAVFRAHVNPPTDSRYLYLGAVLVLLIAVELLPPVLPTTRLLVVLAVFVGASAIANFGSLRSGSQHLQDWSRYVQAELGALELAGPATRADFAPDPVRAPDITAGKYFAAIRDYDSSPASSSSEIARVGEGERQAADSVLLQALGAAVVPEGVAAAEAPAIEASTGGSTTTQDGCVRFVPSGAGAVLDVSVPGQGLLVESRSTAPVELRLRTFADGFPQQPFASISAGTSRLRLPHRPNVRWHARLSASEPFRACTAGIA